MMTYIIYYKINKCQGFGPAREQEKDQEEKVTVSNYLELSAPAESDDLFSLSSKPKTPLLAGSSRTKSAPSERGELGEAKRMERGKLLHVLPTRKSSIHCPAGSLVAFLLAIIRAKKWRNQMLNNL
jgi:hypothetical protein